MFYTKVFGFIVFTVAALFFIFNKRFGWHLFSHRLLLENIRYPEIFELNTQQQQFNLVSLRAKSPGQETGMIWRIGNWRFWMIPNWSLINMIHGSRRGHYNLANFCNIAWSQHEYPIKVEKYLYGQSKTIRIDLFQQGQRLM